MQTTQLGTSDLRSTRLIYGCMRVFDTWEPKEIDETREREARAALEAAVDAGYNHFDHADIYARGECERVFGEFLRDNPGLREKVIITTKCGVRWAKDCDDQAPHRFDLSHEWIVQSCEKSLKRLQIDTIDVYLLHRPDVLLDPDGAAKAFDELKQAGKVRHFGVSNFTTRQTALLQSRVTEPLVCNQLELHPLRLEPFEDGTLNYLHEQRITPTSWGPVAGGRIGDPPVATSDASARLLRALDTEAAAYGVSRTTMAMAWLLKHPSGILPIVGTRRPERIREAVAADEVELSREAWYRIYLAARGRPIP